MSSGRFDITDVQKLFKKRLKGVDTTDLEKCMEKLIPLANRYVYLRAIKKRHTKDWHVPSPEEESELTREAREIIMNGIDKNFPDFNASTSIIGAIPFTVMCRPRTVAYIICDTYDYMNDKCKTYWKEHKATIKKNNGNLTDEEAVFYENYFVPKEDKSSENIYDIKMVEGFCTEIKHSIYAIKDAIEHIENEQKVSKPTTADPTATD